MAQAINGLAQARKYDGQNWTGYTSANSSLPSGNIRCIAADAQGNIWVGTNAGLARFNGSLWTVYTTANSQLIHDTIQSIYIDAQNTVWLGTPRGLCKYAASIFTGYYGKLGLIASDVNDIGQDKQGNTWFMTGRGFSRFNGQQWTGYDKYTSGYAADSLGARMTFDTSGNLWYCRNHVGIGMFNGTNWNVFRTINSGIGSDTTYSLSVDKQNHVWVSGYNCISRYDGNNWTVYTPTNTPVLDTHLFNWVSDIAVDNQNNKWFGTQSGLLKFDGTNWTLFNTGNSGLTMDYIDCVYVDSLNNKWIGTHGSGLNKYNDTFWQSYTTSNSGITDNVIWAVSSDKKGRKWISTQFSGGVDRLDNANWVHFDSQNKPGVMANNHVKSILTDRQGKIWLGFGYAGVTSIEYLSPESANPITNSSERNEVAVFPNPTTGKLNIKMRHQGQLFSIYSITGVLMYETIISKPVTELQIESFTPGTYIYRYGAASGSFIKH